MKLNLFENPPPLWFGEGEDEKFALMLRPCTEADRMHILDSLSIGLAALQAAVNRLVIGWQEVCDAQGMPISFEAMDVDRRKVCNLGRFLGAVPLALQFQVLTAIVAFIGLPTSSLAGIAATLPGGETVDARPTEKPASATPAGASAG